MCPFVSADVRGGGRLRDEPKECLRRRLPPVVMIKILSNMIISFALHQTVWGVSPASCDELNIKLHDYFISRYIKLFEVCHPPVTMNKILSCMIIFFALHQTVWGVSPASCDDQNINCMVIFFALLQTVCHPPVVINILGCVIISFRLHQTFWRVLPPVTVN